MKSQHIALAVAALAVAFTAADASAQTRSGGRQGANGRGYSYSVTRAGSMVSGSVQTNAGYGATGTHTGSVNGYGAYVGSSTVTTNNGSNVTTHGYGKNGYVAGTATATGPGGQTATAGGALYIP